LRSFEEPLVDEVRAIGHLLGVLGLSDARLDPREQVVGLVARRRTARRAGWSGANRRAAAAYRVARARRRGRVAARTASRRDVRRGAGRVLRGEVAAHVDEGAVDPREDLSAWCDR